jgi:hypothetical protein
MKARIAILGAAAALLSMATFSAPASAQYYRYHNSSRTMTRCDRDGDRCAQFRCDWNGDDCQRVTAWRRPAYNRNYSYGYGRYGYRSYDRDRYDRDNYRRCDADGDNCRY